MSQRNQAIQLKRDKARLLMAEVDTHLQNEFYTTAINRLYYGCFHITKALLLTKDLAPKNHSGTSHLLHQHFVSQNLFDKMHTFFFGKLMQERIYDDYSDFLILERKEIEKYIEPAREYFQYVKHAA
jgi:uncharacterized protein (UPF0332 family)